MTQYQEYMGRFLVQASQRTFNVGETQHSVNLGQYYLRGYDGEATRQFLEEMQNKIRATPGHGNANVKFEGGVVNIVLNVPSPMWFCAAITNILGFTQQELSNINPHVAGHQPRYCWRPSRPASAYPADISSPLAPRSTTIYGRSADGTTFTTPRSTLYDGTFEYSMLPQNVVIPPEGGTVFADFKQFFVDVIAAGMPIRMLPDRDVYNSASYQTIIFGEDGGGEIGSVQDFMGRYVDKWNGVWSVSFPMLKHTVADENPGGAV